MAAAFGQQGSCFFGIPMSKRKHGQEGAACGAVDDDAAAAHREQFETALALYLTSRRKGNSRTNHKLITKEKYDEILRILRKVEAHSRGEGAGEKVSKR